MLAVAESDNEEETRKTRILERLDWEDVRILETNLDFLLLSPNLKLEMSRFKGYYKEETG